MAEKRIEGRKETKLLLEAAGGSISRAHIFFFFLKRYGRPHQPVIRNSYIANLKFFAWTLPSEASSDTT